ncbi:unnamed protein product [Trifolium pratense]|uniref:Uncharacterized protein n=1 Tax=Trifolium pratense TaxID=57577 RepID=A0ACB0KAT0_TRIPR|nr:unnamed protein product [Trifolium pratense]
MNSKNAMLILGLLAMILLISSEVSARDLTETSTDTKKDVVEQTDGLNNALFPAIKFPPIKPPKPPRGNGCGQKGCCGRINLGFYCSTCC